MIEPNTELDASLLQLVDYQGQSEHTLIKTLQQSPWNIFSEECFLDELLMFQSHFILFNALYRLRAHGLSSDRFDLEIHSLSIRKVVIAPSPKRNELLQADPLETYYLDWTNLQQTNLEDVQALLNDFWLKMAGYSAPITESELDSALQQFGFDRIPSQQLLKQQFRRLSFNLHPDQGGDKQAFSKLQKAYRLIKKAQA